MHRVRRTLTPYLLLTPYFFLFLTLSLFPILYSLMISFTSWNGIGAMHFVGAQNYIRLFLHDKFFYKSLYNTFLIIVISIPLETVLGLLLAVFLKDFFQRFRNTFQLIIFLPYITTPVAVGIIFQIMFDWKNGTVNALLSAFGASPIYWLGEPWASRIVVIIMLTWTLYGYKMVLFLSGLSTIPEELYESAKIDGSRWIDSFFHITIPMLKPIMTFVIITSIITGFRLFDQPKLLFDSATQPLGGPDQSVLTVVMRYYQISFQDFQFGYGAATAYSLFIVIALFSFLFMKLLVRKEDA